MREALLPAVAPAVEAALNAIRAQWPEVDRAGAALTENLRRGVSDGIGRWFHPAAPDDGLHVELGRAQARAGRSLDELMAFYRIGAQAAWRKFTEFGSAIGIEPGLLYRIAETGFGGMDQFSTQAAAGFAEEHSYLSGTSQSRRTELVRLMLRRPQPPYSSLVAAARAARTELTPTLALFVGPAEHYDRIARSPLQDVVLGPREDEFVGAVLDPAGPGRMRQLAVAASRAEITLALGPVVPVSDARTSVARARALHALIQAGLVPREPLVDATRHDIDLLLSAEPRLARDIARQRLAPIETISGKNARANLEATLEAWLRRPGQRKTIAHELGIHPQTVRYRVAKLRDLFGDSLDDPDERFELQLALRVRPYSRLDATQPAPRTS